MTCCNQKAVMATSCRGRRFFKHYRLGNCKTGDETPEHLECKYVIYETALALRYEAEMEAPVGNRTVDVLVKTANGDYAFEIQLSRQIVSEFMERTADHLSAEVIPLWLTKERMWRRTRDFIPSFVTNVEDLSNIRVESSETERIKLDDFVRAILEGTIALEYDLESYVPPSQPAETEDEYELSDFGLRLLGWIALGAIGLAGLVYWLSPKNTRTKRKYSR